MALTTLGSLRWLFLVLLQISLSSATNSAASFLYPSTSQTLDVADTIVVEWSSDYTAPTLFTWMRNHTDDSGYQVSINNGVNPNSALSYRLLSYINNPAGLAYPAEIWYNLVYNISNHAGQNSPSIFITSQANKIGTTYARTLTTVQSSTTISSSSTSTSTTSTTSTQSAVVVSPPSTVTPTATGTNSASTSGSTTKSSGLSTDASIGIGVGIGMAVILIAGLGIFAFRLYRRNRRLKRQLGVGNENNPMNESQNFLDSSRKGNGDLPAKPYAKSPISTDMSELRQPSPPMYRGSDFDRHNIQQGPRIELDAGESPRR